MSVPSHRRPSRTAGRAELPPSGVTVRRAREAGWTPSAQRHAVAAGDLARPQAGVLDRPDPSRPDTAPWQRQTIANIRSARASALACPRAVISHQSAALVWQIPVLRPRDRGCVTVPDGTALRRLAGAHLHRAELPGAQIAVRAGFTITEPTRTVLDVSREHGIEAGLVAADFALHTELSTPESLAACAHFCRNWPGIRTARFVVSFADGRAESPLESLSRLRMRRHGLAAPDLQPWILDEHGVVIGRCDFYWDDLGVVGEADGNLKYAGGQSAIVAERDRQRALEDTGLVVVRWGWDDLARFAVVARRLEAAFARGYPPDSPQRRWTAVPT